MAAISISLPLLSPLVLVLVSLTQTHAFGFTADLIHRDSPQSPFYNPSNTKMDRLNDAIKRSFSRAAHFKKSLSVSPNTIQSQIIPVSGEYLLKLSIGTPPVQTLVSADTGSDLIWTQCKPCIKCFKQNLPIFDPKKSSTYHELSCPSQPCKAIPTTTCNKNTCQYAVTYGDGSRTIGTAAVETFTLGSTSGRPVSVPKVTFGCGRNNEGTFQESGTGIAGLGGGSASLISQLGNLIDGKFSYCLSGFRGKDTVTSKINFGANAIVSGSNVVSTPIVPSKVDTFYHVTLQSITVGNKTLAFETKMKADDDDDGTIIQEGNIIIDSGTTLTLLPFEFYKKLVPELKLAIKSKPKNDPQGLLDLCYSDNNVVLPKITFKFAGAELVLPPTTTFVQNGELLCLAMLPTDQIAIFGNLNQINFLIGFDRVRKRIFFKPTDCTKNN